MFLGNKEVDVACVAGWKSAGLLSSLKVGAGTGLERRMMFALFVVKEPY